MRVYYTSVLKWLCDSSITSIRMEKNKKVASRRLRAPFLLPSSLPSTPGSLRPLFSRSSAKCFRPHAAAPLSSRCACAICERARGSGAGLHASERCLGLILGYSWRRRQRGGVRAESLHRVNMALNVPEQHGGRLKHTVWE